MVNHPPGRELDLEIGRKIIKVMIVMDDADGEYKVISPRTKNRGILPHYSTNLDHAHILIEALQYKGFYCKLGSTVKDGETVFRCAFFKADQPVNEATGITIPHAIALAALDLQGLV